jgi:lysyl-tRNA synthetase class 2
MTPAAAAAAPPWWSPAEAARRRPFLLARARLLRALRRFFEERDFLEVDTPALQVSPGLEPHLKAFATDWHPPLGEEPRRFYLHTSPEFAMKKLLVAGWPRIFQVAPVFRDGERSDHHHPAFTMLEWYRAGATYRDLMDETADLLAAVGVADPVSRLSVAEAFAAMAGIDVLATVPDAGDPDPPADALRAEARRIGVAVGEGDRWDDVFFHVFLDRIEPRLGRDGPVILHDWPACMAALARRSAADPRLCERFEVYWRGVELANAFGELTDPTEQRRRFQHDMDVKEALYGERYPVDEDFLAALDHGLPESAGIALGVDRLVMALTGAPRIEDVLWAPMP